MLLTSIAAGFRALRARPGLAALLFLVNLAVALVLSIPVGVALDLAVTTTGFDADLASGLDVVLLADIFQRSPDLFVIMARQLTWIIPLILVWKTAMGIGLVHALQGDGTGSFWTGVGRHFRRAFGLGLLYLVGAGIVIGASVIIGTAVAAMSGEVWTYRTWVLIVPAMLVIGLAKLDLMHDFGRIAIVLQGRPVFSAFIAGIRFPLKHGRVILLYVFWAVAAAVLWLLPTVVEAAVGASLLVFLLQQVLLLGRAGVTVGWIGSEVAFFEGQGAPQWVPDVVTTDEAPDTPVGFA